MLAVIGAFTVATFAIVFGVVFDAWFVHTLYDWFVPVIFASAPALTMAQIAGVLLVFRAAEGIPIPKKDDDKVEDNGFYEATRILGWRLSLSFTTLLVGWCIKTFWL